MKENNHVYIRGVGYRRKVEVDYFYNVNVHFVYNPHFKYLSIIP